MATTLYIDGKVAVSGGASKAWMSQPISIHGFIQSYLDASGYSSTASDLATVLAVGNITGGTDLTVSAGDSFLFEKESNYAITVADSTTATEDGGALDITTGAGATTGGGGFYNVTTGNGGVTGVGGDINMTSGDGGATSGAAGNINVTSGDATIGQSGDISIASGNTASGRAGDIVLETGTHTSIVVSPVISLNKAVIRKPLVTSIATGAAADGATALAMLGGNITMTGANGDLNLPTAAALTTAIGSTPAGTTFDFAVNTVGMTATNTATVKVGANTVLHTGDSDTVVNTAGINVGQFRLTYITATTCILFRLA